MTNQVDIANAALSRLGHDVAIVSMTEKTKYARVLSRAWDRVRDFVLADGVWQFATKVQPLAVSVDDPPPGWSVRYAIPGDCVAVVALCDEMGARWDWRGMSSRYDFERNGESLCADVEGAWLVYVERVADTERWPAGFVEAFICRLALDTAAGVVGEAGLRMRSGLMQEYEFAIAKARANDLNEGRDMLGYVTPTLAARDA